MFNDELILIKNNYTYEKSGVKEPHEVRTPILCEVRSATRTEFYEYGDNESRPEYIVTINSCEFNNEKTAEFKGHKYKITRIYEVDRDLTEITLSRKTRR